MIWGDTVDNGEFSAQVLETDDPYFGRLVVKVVETDEVLLDAEVGVMFGAQFGPDIDDVHHWQQMTIVAVDKYIDSRKEGVN